jgi:hypothetical protein
MELMSVPWSYWVIEPQVRCLRSRSATPRPKALSGGKLCIGLDGHSHS